MSLGSDAQIAFRMTLDGGGAAGSITGAEHAFLDDINARLATRKDYPSTLAAITDKADFSHYLVVLVKNGLFFEAWLVRKKVREISLRTTVSASERSYYRAELYGNSRRLAVTNPIYFNFATV